MMHILCLRPAHVTSDSWDREHYVFGWSIRLCVSTCVYRTLRPERWHFSTGLLSTSNQVVYSVWQAAINAVSGTQLVDNKNNIVTLFIVVLICVLQRLYHFADYCTTVYLQEQ